MNNDFIQRLYDILADIEKMSLRAEDEYRDKLGLADDEDGDEVCNIIADVTDELWAVRVLIDAEMGPPYRMTATTALLEARA